MDDAKARPLMLAAVLCSSVFAACVQPRCFASIDCPAPQICSATGACVFECSDDAGCASGFVCENHVCRPAPARDITCPSDMVPVAKLFCVDRYEASRGDASATSSGSDATKAHSVAGVMPWMVASNDDAALACEAAGKRLCSPAEWQLACEGPDGTAYSYGESYEPIACNGIDAFGRSAFHLAATGSFAGCTNAWGVFDINGNLWEHVAGGDDMTVRGGAFNCSDSAALHRCDYIPQTWIPSARGFRCCADGSAP